MDSSLFSQIKKNWMKLCTQLSNIALFQSHMNSYNGHHGRRKGVRMNVSKELDCFIMAFAYSSQRVETKEALMLNMVSYYWVIDARTQNGSLTLFQINIAIRKGYKAKAFRWYILSQWKIYVNNKLVFALAKSPQQMQKVNKRNEIHFIWY